MSDTEMIKLIENNTDLIRANSDINRTNIDLIGNNLSMIDISIDDIIDLKKRVAELEGKG